MRLITWNVNSVRQRLTHLQKIMDKWSPDVICLQETKAQDSDFPMDDIKALGFEHVEILGQKSYNGVAILSRYPLSGRFSHNWTDKQDCRHLQVTLPNGIELHNFYVPAGGDVPDLDTNPKFVHKLDFVDEMTSWFKDNRSNKTPMILVGDLNIAPLESDVWSHKQLLKIISHTPIEVEKLTAVMDTFGWVDAMRHFIPEPEPLFTWWSYRSRDWKVSNRGRRLDHMWVTDPLVPKLKNMQVLDEARSWEKPSDHAPVLLEFDE